MPASTRGRPGGPADAGKSSVAAAADGPGSARGNKGGARGSSQGRVRPVSPPRKGSMRQGRDLGRGNAGNPGLAIDSDGGEGQPLLLAKGGKGGKGANGDRGSAAVARGHEPVHNGVASHAAGAAAGGALSESWNMVLLVVLYMMQGVPLGLTTGAMPFMLQSKLTYTQVGVFGLASYPYSLKLLWSPIVDSCYSASFGRRKSWIVPVQLATAAMLVACAGLIQRLFDAADVNALTALFLVFVFLAATQDIAVDGWALTLLSPQNVGYASTCQTIGVTLGYFTSFTVFLALNNGAFCDSYVRSWAPAWLFGQHGAQVPLVSLPGYLRFWGWVFALATVGIAVLQPEKNFTEEEERERQKRHEAAAAEREAAGAENGSGIGAGAIGRQGARKRHGAASAGQPTKAAAAAVAVAPGTSDGASAGGYGAVQEVVAAYRQLWGVVQLPAVWALSAFLLTYRLGVLSTESAYSLKLIDKGVSKEALAFLVLFQFPVELCTAVLAGRWAANHSPSGPFITGYLLRLGVCACLLLLTSSFPPGASSLTEHVGPFGMLAVVSLVQSFASTLTFTALGSFFNTISDPAMGGAYLTLLNTIANMGYLLPRTPLFWAIDVLTVPRCVAPSGDAADASATLFSHLACPKKAKDMASGNACTDAGGVCELVSDGFYLISWVTLVLGVLLGVAYMRLLPLLMRLPLTKWRVPSR